MTYSPPDSGRFGPPGPPVPPPYGYVVPVSQYGAPDPLVTSVTEGFSGWFNRVFAVLRRNWRSLLLISWTTFVAPIAVLAIVVVVVFGRLVVLPEPGSSQSPTFDSALLGTVILIGCAGAAIAGFATCVAQAATVWSITREAAGQPGSIGAALGYGLRNGFRLFGWGLLYGLLILAGTCACFFPGLYFALAGCLYVPVALYRRGMSPISTSFSLINRNFGASLGRMAVLLLILYGVQTTLAVPVQLLSFESRPVVAISLSVALQILTAPLALVPTVGSSLLFAELWNRQSPITVADLDAALGP